MKFSTRKDIAASPAAAFAVISDFDTIADQARAQGATVERLDAATTPATGHWKIGFDFRGKRRVSESRITTYDPPQQLALRSRIEGLVVLLNIEILEVAPDKSRLFYVVELKPETMRAGLVVQSMKLARGTIEKRFEKRIGKLTARIESQARA
ncbi:SRPBCC family protein [Palleronia sediminis]|nr:SRPBCC family protein [Palleronia sediminis]